MSKSIRFFLTGTLIFFCQCFAYAQQSCDEKVTEAETEFNAGHFYAIPGILQDCLTDGDLSNEQKVRAYLLLCQVYLIIDDKIAAEDSYLRLLKADPEFLPNEKDHPIDIVYLSKKFTATPIFTPHFRLGFNTSVYRSVYSVSTEPYGVQSKNSIVLGIQAGGGIDWNINDFLSLCAEINGGTRGFDRTRSNISGNDEQSVNSSQAWIDLPIYIKYSYYINQQIRLFGYTGFALNYLISSNNQFTYTDVKPTQAQLVSTGPNEAVLYQQNQFNKSWVIGGGVKYKIGIDFFYADLRYMAGLSNLTMDDKSYYADPKTVASGAVGNPDYYLSGNITKYRYTSDLFRLDNISISFGFVHPIYNPRKIKKARTKGVSRDIKRKEGGKQ